MIEQLFKDNTHKCFKSMETQEVDGQTLDLLHCAIGIAGEAGELVDAIKKHFFYGQVLDEENVKEELGDLLFYIQSMCDTLNYSTEEIMNRNIKKLSKRYPDGYSDADAKTRADKGTEDYGDPLDWKWVNPEGVE